MKKSLLPVGLVGGKIQREAVKKYCFFFKLVCFFSSVCYRWACVTEVRPKRHSHVTLTMGVMNSSTKLCFKRLGQLWWIKLMTSPLM